jgi:hypothetical protein
MRGDASLRQPTRPSIPEQLFLRESREVTLAFLNFALLCSIVGFMPTVGEICGKLRTRREHGALRVSLLSMAKESSL